jgi:hypothetical protein
MHYMREEKNKELTADQCYEDNLQQRVLQAFKFNLLMVKSVELMETKRTLGLKTRAFGGLKWQCEMAKTQEDYHSIVKHRELKDHFYSWYEAAYVSQKKKQILGNLMEKKHYYDQLESFGIWKRDSFFKTMVSLVDQMIVQPKEYFLISDVFHAWKRAQEFDKVKDDYNKLADANYQVTLAKRMFISWKESATPSMKKCVDFKRACRKINSVMVSAPYYMMIAISEKEKVKEDKVYYMMKIKKAQFIVKVIQAWKETITESKIENKKIQIINSHFKANSRNTEVLDDIDSEITFELFKDHQKHPIFKYPNKLEVQITCIKAFQDYSETKDNVLKRKYFNALKFTSKVLKTRNEQFEYSSTLYSQNLKRKYIRLMVTGYNNQLDKQQNRLKADQFYSEKSIIKYWVNFHEGIKNSKREAICDAIHDRNLAAKTIAALKYYTELKVKKALLNQKEQEFVAHKSELSTKNSYFIWKHHYQLQSYYGKAIEEFDNFRAVVTKRAVFSAIKNRAESKKTLKDLEFKAKDYFTKKIEFRLIKSAFIALNRHTQKGIFTNTGKADELAEQHRMTTFGRKCFEEWIKQSKLSIEKERTSTRYSVFSAWKHYSKQNALVKKYLKECDYSSGNYESNYRSPVRNNLKATIHTISDEDLLSPIELKENKGMFNTNHPNVLANTQPKKFQYHKYY